MTKRLTGLLAVIGCAGRRAVLVVVMTEMLGGLVLFVPAIIRHRCPGDLEREQAEQDEREQTSHGEHYIYYGLTLSIVRRRCVRASAQAGVNIGMGGPPSVGLNVTRTCWPIRIPFRSQSTMLVIIDTPSSSVT